jgi:tetratricopeptide (TPR) repeat protein
MPGSPRSIFSRSPPPVPPRPCGSPDGAAGSPRICFSSDRLPALGFFNVYPFVFSWVADHFQYLASLAVFALAGSGLAALTTRWPRTGRILGGALVMGLGMLTWHQAGDYRDPTTLFESTLRRNPGCWMAHNNLAEVLTHSGRPAEAVPHLEAALRLRPEFAEAENNLGDDLRRLGRAAEALPHLERAVRLRPSFVQAHNNLGIALMEMGRTDDGISRFEKALKLNPAFPLAHANLGLALAQNGRARMRCPISRRPSGLIRTTPMPSSTGPSR